MCDPGDSNSLQVEKIKRETASRIAEQVASLLRDARAAKFEFLAYLLGMVLKEARRLTKDEDKSEGSPSAGCAAIGGGRAAACGAAMARDR